MIDRPKKVNALLTLLKFSSIFPVHDKEKIQINLNNFSDDDIMNLGKILSYEHKNRGSLDKSLIQDFLKNLKKKI